MNGKRYGFVLFFLISVCFASIQSAECRITKDLAPNLVYLRTNDTGGEVFLPNSFGYTVVNKTFNKSFHKSKIKIHWDGNIRTEDNSMSGCDVLIKIDSITQQNRFFNFTAAPNGTVHVEVDFYIDAISAGLHQVSVEINPGGHPITLSPTSEQRRPWLLEVFEIN